MFWGARLPWRSLALFAVTLGVLVCYPVLISVNMTKSVANVATLLGVIVVFLSWRQFLASVPPSRHLAVRAFAAGLGLSTVLVMLEYNLDMPVAHIFLTLFERPLPYLYVYDRGIVILSLLLWSLVGLLRLPLWATTLALAGVVALVQATSSQASLAGFSVGALFYLLATWRARLAQLALGTMIIAALLFMPVMCYLMPTFIDGSVDIWPAANGASRLKIWSQTAQAIWLQPIQGHGIEASRYLPVVRDHIHPHNGILQLWIEFGLIGILAMIAIVISVLQRAQLTPAAVATAAGWLVIFCVSYNIWQPWWLAMPFILASVSQIVSPTYAATARAV